MTTTIDRDDALQWNRRLVAELFSEERRVLERIQKQARTQSPKGFLRFLKNPPLFWWPLYW